MSTRLHRLQAQLDDAYLRYRAYYTAVEDEVKLALQVKYQREIACGPPNMAPLARKPEDVAVERLKALFQKPAPGRVKTDMSEEERVRALVNFDPEER
jgi:hypothetical protein